MYTKKLLYIITIIFLTIFLLSVILIITNTLNMWLVGIVSLIISVISFLLMNKLF